MYIYEGYIYFVTEEFIGEEIVLSGSGSFPKTACRLCLINTNIRF